MDLEPNQRAKCRGAQIDPPNRFEPRYYAADWESLTEESEPNSALRIIQTEFLPDDSKSIVTENDSPDIGFRYSLNPYRGCEHGCAYCYARPTHETLGYSAGLDFETRILVKHHAPELLLEFLSRPSWRAEQIVLSGVTDPYQPIERRLGITRRCIEVMAEARQPFGIVTKNVLLLRDVDLLGELAASNLVRVCIGLTTLDAELAHAMEPRTPRPKARLEAITRLTAAGVPVVALLAPIIPGLTECEIPSLLRAAKEAGAVAAGFTLLRLPGAVREVFLDWLHRIYPLKASKVEGMIQSTRGGKWNDSRFGSRMHGQGPIAEQISKLFHVFATRFGLNGSLPPLETKLFQPPVPKNGQLWLF